MKESGKFFLSRLRERLWIRPLAMGILSVALVLLAKAADLGGLEDLVPNIKAETIDALLKVIATSMLVIATFAVGSMVTSYGSASRTATPRSFPLVVSDDVSQNALSSFIGAFIFSIVALTALLNGIYGKAGRFALFLLTLLTFAAVILTFVRWVDRIARLGRLGTIMDKAESSTAKALKRRRLAPTLGAARVRSRAEKGQPIYGETVGYVQQLELDSLQEYAQEHDLRIQVAALPGAFLMPDRPLAFIMSPQGDVADPTKIVDCFVIDDDRTFDEDPRFGLLVLSEMASRALSPAVNDPGTAIDILNAYVRLFSDWAKPVEERKKRPILYDRIEVPELSMSDMFEDAFGAIARDGASIVEVGIRLQKSLASLAAVGDEKMREAAAEQACVALARAKQALEIPGELARLKAASMVHAPASGETVT